MKKAMLWVKILTAAAAVTAVGAVIMLIVPLLSSTMTGAPVWQTNVILAHSYALLPPALLLLWALIRRPERPCRPVLAAAAVAAAIPCSLFFYDWFHQMILRDGGGLINKWQLGWLAFEEWPRFYIKGAAAFLTAVRWELGLAAMIGILFLIWTAVDSLLRHRGLAVSRGLVSVYALLRAAQSAFLFWEFTVTLRLFTDPYVSVISRPSSLQPFFDLCCILSGLCLIAAWTVLIWGGLKRSEKP